MPEKKQPAIQSQEIVPVLQAFLNAPDMKTTQRVLESSKRVLFSLKAEEILLAFIQQVEKDGDHSLAQHFNKRLDLLRDCKKHGIKTIFSFLGD